LAGLADAPSAEAWFLPGNRPNWRSEVEIMPRAAGAAPLRVAERVRLRYISWTSRANGAMADPVVALVADHAGFELKNALKGVLHERGFTALDLGPQDAAPVDYPEMARKLASAVRDGDAQRGVLICGTGIGIGIAANRYPWIRAAVCHDVTTARLAREHNDANVLALGARLIGLEVARDCLLTFLGTAFAGGRHARRVAKLSTTTAP
jgi:ribose 5-phosphate isomerase B